MSVHVQTLNLNLKISENLRCYSHERDIPPPFHWHIPEDAGGMWTCIQMMSLCGSGRVAVSCKQTGSQRRSLFFRMLIS